MYYYVSCKKIIITHGFIKKKITTNDKSFNVLNALDSLQKHIIDFTHQKKLA